MKGLTILQTASGPSIQDFQVLAYSVDDPVVLDSACV